jgi:CspA family cold shock protein
MSDKHQVVTCQRCGIGFIMTPNHAAFLARCGVNVVEPVQCLTCYWKAGPLPKQQGKIKWFNTRKRYGFIVDTKDREIFFHQDQFIGENEAKLQDGQPTRFHVGYSVKGPKALNVELVSD